MTRKIFVCHSLKKISVKETTETNLFSNKYHIIHRERAQKHVDFATLYDETYSLDKILFIP